MNISPLISIIICTQNRADDLRQTLASLAAVSIPDGCACELLLIDNASQDHTASVIAQAALPNMTVRRFFEPRKGKSIALNLGLCEARGEILVFTDDDLRFPQHWLSALCHPLRSGQADAVAGLVSLAPHLVRPWMEPAHRYWLAETDRNAHGDKIDMIGANMAFSRAVLEKVPEFDTNLGPGARGFADDTLFSRQLWVAGYKIIYAEDAEVEHHFLQDRLTRNKLVNTAKRRGETIAYLNHHWHHKHIVLPALRMLHKRLQVALWRLRHPRETAVQEGLPSGEMYNLEAFHYYQQFLIERRKPRLYAKHGLVKIAKQQG